MILRFNRAYNIFFLLFFANIALLAQQTIEQKKTYPFYVEPAAHYGFIAAHKANMHNLVNKHLQAYEICLGVNSNSDREWQKLYNNPDYGFMYLFINLQNKKHLGNAHGFMPFFNFPLFNFNNKLKESFRLGTGVGYLTKKHNRLYNYKNFIIGSDLNAAISMHFITSLKLSQKIDLNASFGLTHFSNGSFRQPNIGINIPSVRISSKYHFGNYKGKERAPKQIIEPYTNKLRYSFIGGYGIKEIWGRADKEKFNVFFFESNIYKPLSKKSSLAAGLDLFYDESDFVILDKDTINYNSKTEIIQPGVHLAHDLKISDLSIVFLTGKYLYQKEKKDGSIYTKLALRYHLKNKFIMELSLKAHLATAEFIGYGIGYKF